ncbi:hypothetical protein [Mycobacteroides chelonae]|uniref:hypothetical protein n=1 Tax=Mycobacteroides chelonae TaxID=1774 RepID=UPI001041E93E|nr:hypothetical protein [Mycobacteroides chelonae]
MNIATVRIPEPTPSDFYGASWEVPVTCSMTGRKRTGIHAAEVFIRRTDGRIGLSGVSSVMENSEDVRALAAALLAAADYLDQRNT